MEKKRYSFLSEVFLVFLRQVLISFPFKMTSPDDPPFLALVNYLEAEFEEKGFVKCAIILSGSS